MSNVNSTIMGVAKLSSIIDSVRYTRQHFSRDHGTWWDRDADELFLDVSTHGSLEGCRGSFSGSMALQARLVDKGLVTWFDGERAGSLQIIPRHGSDLCLLVRRAPPRYVGSEYLALVHADEVRALLSTAREVQA